MTLSDFDTLDCPTCDAPTAPGSVSAGPVAAYRCTCGTSWRINPDGDQTHLRLTQRAQDRLVDDVLNRLRSRQPAAA